VSVIGLLAVDAAHKIKNLIIIIIIIIILRDKEIAKVKEL
jgi:hypothetical protein